VRFFFLLIQPPEANPAHAHLDHYPHPFGRRVERGMSECEPNVLREKLRIDGEADNAVAGVAVPSSVETQVSGEERAASKLVK
jgi:hypothetical protein